MRTGLRRPRSSGGQAAGDNFSVVEQRSAFYQYLPFGKLAQQPICGIVSFVLTEWVNGVVRSCANVILHRSEASISSSCRFIRIARPNSHVDWRLQQHLDQAGTTTARRTRGSCDRYSSTRYRLDAAGTSGR